ncbi:hypothetical protein [Natrinema sp. H-ect4]|uniref:hypothetical protein n=1 Tax=Natrinema sp. H-ect4 TaxID=3242699 RepID=UPI0035A93687
MKDVFVQENREDIKSKLSPNFDGRFCYYRDLDGKPEKTKAGKKILFSTGQRVIAESTIIEIEEDYIRFDPLTPVSKPNPASPSKRGLKYVNAEDCGKYDIRIMGIEHSYKNTHKLVRGILENRMEARNDRDLLKHIIWTKAQDLDLSDYDDFQERIEPGYIDKVVNEIQLQNCAYPPTDPDVLKSMFKHSKKVNRHFDSLEEFVNSAVKFYDRDGSKSEAKKINSSFSFQGSGTVSTGAGDQMDSVKEKVKQVVAQD